MSTCFNDKRTYLDAVVGGGSGGFHHDDARYKNLNLNQQQPHHECHQIVTSNNTSSGWKEYHGSGGYKQADLQMSDHRGGSWKGDQKIETTPKLSVFDKKEEKAMKFDSNKSTLSLHIAAYENSVEAENAQKAVEDNRMIGKTWKDVKKILSDSAKMDSFEIPRQQTVATTNPEVMQFRSSQQLANTHQSNSSQEMEENNDDDDDDDGDDKGGWNKKTNGAKKNRNKHKPDHFMSISLAAAQREDQHACRSDILESFVTFDGKSYPVRYRILAYPYGYDKAFVNYDSFNIVIQLVENPLFDKAKLKAACKIYFWDKNGKKHVFEDSKDFDKSSASTDIRLMSNTEFQKIMKTEGQDIHFKVGFTADGDLTPFGNRDKSDSTKCTSSFPFSLSNLSCARASPEYYCNGVKWQYWMFGKDEKLWIDFQVLENPYGRKLNATFTIDVNGKKKPLRHQFGESLQSGATEIMPLQKLQKIADFVVAVDPNFKVI